MSNERPDIRSLSSGPALRQWYWLKTELAAEARRLGLKSSGAKFDILERLCHFHDSGSKDWPGERRTTATSRFDWHSCELSEHTVITDNYKNTQNVRRFFILFIDDGFRFNIEFMQWMRDNVGKTLGDAGRFYQEQKQRTDRTTIMPHNQFNQYVRDFLDDNPELSMEDAHKAWALKRQLPTKTGRHRYHADDLLLLR